MLESSFPQIGFALVLGFAVFIIVFIRTEAAIALVLLSMMLSPEVSLGGSGQLAEKREVVIRSEDLLLMLIAFSWLAKTAVNKELGLILRTALNRPILAYVVTTSLATLIGFATGTVRTAAGFFYVLKYVEYFFVFFMVVNNVRDREQAWRLVTVAFVTVAVVSLVGIAQIPSGERVSAPFEGETGEPNTLGGYLLLMMGLAAGVAFETTRIRTRALCLGLAVLMLVPFVFTLSRSSYLGLIPVVATLFLLSRRRKILLPLLILVVVTSPLLVVFAPAVVQKRVAETFRPQANQPRVSVGRVGFDPSTPERLIGYRGAAEKWLERPILGHGVTGGFYLDAQYPRTLMETGILGFAAFGWLVWSILKRSLLAFERAAHAEDRGLARGFIAGTVGLMFHALGSNTFIIVRIMEPFWFFVGIMMLLTSFEGATRAPEAARGRRVELLAGPAPRLAGSPPWQRRAL